MNIRILIICCCLHISPAIAQLPDVEVSPTTIYLGETIQIKINADSTVFPTSVHWILPDSISPFQYLVVDTTFANRCLVQLTAWDTGYLRLKSFQLFYMQGKSIKRIPVTIPKINVKWAKFSGKEAEDIKPIFEPQQKTNYSLQALIGVLFLLATGLFLFFYFRKKKQTEQLIQGSLKETITGDAFLSYLQQLRPYEWNTREKQKEAFIQVRNRAQQYMAYKTGVITADTFMEQINHPFLFSDASMLSSFTRIAELTDNVIYGKYQATKEEIEEMLLLFQTFVQQKEAELPKQDEGV